MEILLIHPGGLGDVILSLPAVALLRKRFPSARITIAGNLDHLVPVVSEYAERTISISTLPLHHLSVSGPVPEAAVKFWRSFDIIISWTGGGDPEFARRFKEIHPNVHVVTWRPAAGESRHVSQLFVDSLSFGGNVDIVAEFTPILLNAELRAEGKRWLTARGWNGLDPLACIHPGAGSRTKRWPVSRFAQLAQHLALQEKKKLLIIEGDAERGLSKEIVTSLPGDSAIVFDSMSLSLLAAAVAHCGLFIGNDSGVAHLAAALSVRSIVIFGPTLPQHWAPLGRDVTILRNPQGCESCIAAGENHSCLKNITVEEVIRNSKL